MYSFISGTIEERQENLIVVNNNGIGYELIVSSLTTNNCGSIGDEIKLYTYLYVREDCMQLFGFHNKQEKEMFLSLTSVSGIGAKTAIQMLSSLTVPQLVNAIIIGDVKSIASIKGIGKKTAERIILELKNNINQLNGITLENFADIQDVAVADTCFDEAVNLLVDMGLTKMEAVKTVKRVAEPNDTTELIITKALRNMN